MKKYALLLAFSLFFIVPAVTKAAPLCKPIGAKEMTDINHKLIPLTQDQRMELHQKILANPGNASCILRSAAKTAPARSSGSGGVSLLSLIPSSSQYVAAPEGVGNGFEYVYIDSRDASDNPFDAVAVYLPIASTSDYWSIKRDIYTLGLDYFAFWGIDNTATSSWIWYLPELATQTKGGLLSPGDKAKIDLLSTSTRTFGYSARSLNTCYQVSSTRDTVVNYSVEIGTTATLLGGQTGTVFLEVSDNSSCSTNTQEIGRAVNGNTVSLALAITVTQTVASNLSGIVPAGKYVKIRTANTVGTPTFNYRSGQEVQL